MLGDVCAGDAGAKCQDISVIVFTPHAGGVLIVRKHGPCAWHTVGGDTDSDSRAANDDTRLGFSSRDVLGDRSTKIGIIDRRRSLGAKVKDFEAEGDQFCCHDPLELKPGVIASDRDRVARLGQERSRHERGFESAVPLKRRWSVAPITISRRASPVRYKQLYFHKKRRGVFTPTDRGAARPWQRRRRQT